MKKIAFIIVFSMVFSMFGVYADSAAEETAEGNCNSYVSAELIEGCFLPMMSGPASDVTAEEKIYESLISLNFEVDVSEYELSYEDAMAVFNRVILTCPDLFYISKQVSLWGSYEQIVRMDFSCLYDSDDVEIMQKNFSDYIKKVVSLVPLGSDDFEKTLYLYNYVMNAYEYDYDLDVADAYTMMISGEGVCQGYTLLLKALLDEAGVESDYARSDSLNHVWNTVKIDGNWYNADVTWDDGNAISSYKYFLLSDQALGRDVTEQKYACTGTKYDSYFMKELTSPAGFYNDRIYYNTYGYGIVSADYNGENVRNEISLGRWGNYSYKYGSVIIVGEILYYNNESEVWAKNLRTGNSKMIYATPSGEDIYEIVWSRTNDGFNVYTGTNPNYLDRSSDIIKIAGLWMGQGDLDNDGDITVNDVMCVLQYIVGNNTDIDAVAADVSGNGEVDIGDAVLLLQYTVGYDVIFK